MSHFKSHPLVAQCRSPAPPLQGQFLALQSCRERCERKRDVATPRKPSPIRFTTLVGLGRVELAYFAHKHDGGIRWQGLGRQVYSFGAIDEESTGNVYVTGRRSYTGDLKQTIPVAEYIDIWPERYLPCFPTIGRCAGTYGPGFPPIGSWPGTLRSGFQP